MEKSISIVSIITVLLLTTSVLSQQIVETAPTPEKKNILFAPFSIFSSPLFWGFIIFLSLGIGLLIIAVFVIRAILKYLKLRNDVYYRVKVERNKLAKIQGRYPSRHYFRYKKNTPIRLVNIKSNKLIISNPIAYHRGDYTSHEGNIVISMIMKKKWFVFPVIDLLIIPDKELLIIDKKADDFKKEIQISIDNIPRAKDIIQFNQNEILIFADSISNTGLFYIPVIKDSKGDVIDISLPIFETMKRVVLNDYLYDQSSDFVGIAKKSMDMNPNVRYIQKTGDNSQSVEVPQSDNR